MWILFRDMHSIPSVAVWIALEGKREHIWLLTKRRAIDSDRRSSVVHVPLVYRNEVEVCAEQAR